MLENTGCFRFQCLEHRPRRRRRSRQEDDSPTSQMTQIFGGGTEGLKIMLTKSYPCDCDARCFCPQDIGVRNRRKLTAAFAKLSSWAGLPAPRAQPEKPTHHSERQTPRGTKRLAQRACNTRFARRGPGSYRVNSVSNRPFEDDDENEDDEEGDDEDVGSASFGVPAGRRESRPAL